MPLNLNDLMQKAKDKGITSNNVNNASQQLIRPWQQESILFEKIKEQQPLKEGANNREQIDNKPATRSLLKKTIYEINHNEITKIQTEDHNERIQEPKTGNNPTTSCSLSALVGLQRATIIFIYNECKIARSKVTESLTLEHISSALNTSCGSIKTTIQRLETKGFVKRVCFKQGRGGWSKYSIPDPLFQELLQYESSNKLVTNWQQTENNSIAVRPAIAKGVVSNSMSTMLPEDLKNIDYSVLEEIGFDESHIIQIYREYMKKPELSLSVDIIQDSINALAFDLKHNDVANSLKHHPVVFLTCLLKKGQPYSSKTPEKVLTPREEALQHYLSSKERKIKAQEEKENKLKELEFIEWQSGLTEREINSIIGDKANSLVGSKIMRERSIRSWLLQHFDSEIWPSRREKIIEISCKVD